MSLHPEATALPTMGAVLRLVFHELRQASRMIAGRLLHIVVGGPLSLFYLFTELGLILLGLSIAITGRAQENLMRLALRGVMVWGLAAWILNDYLPLTRAFDGGFNAVANVVLGAGAAWPAHWSPGVLNAATHSFMGAVERLWQALPIFQVGPAIRTGWTRIGSDLIMLLDAFVASFLMAIVVALLTLAYLAFAGVFFMGVALTAIGVAVGPLLVPCLVLPYLSELFHGWFRYLLGAGLYKIVAAIVLMLAAILLSSSVAEVNALSHALAAPAARGSSLWSGAVIFVYVFYLLLAASFILLMLRQIPAVVGHLTSGRGGAGTGTWSALGSSLGGIGRSWAAGGE
jgi:hypothetical protein